MATENSLMNNSERSDDTAANKRFKIDHTDNLLQQVCTSNNHHSIGEPAIVDKATGKDHIDVSQTDGYTTINKDRPSNFEIMPNELFFQICSYMDHIDIVHAFIGLNQRFNALTFECVRQFQVLDTVPLTRYVENMAHIEHAIELISLYYKSIPHIFTRHHLLPNLRSIIITRPFSFTVKLNVEHRCSVCAIVPCLKLLRMFSIWTERDSYNTSRFNFDYIERTSIARMTDFFNTLPCSAIEHLSVYIFHAEDWMCLCSRAPNLTHLRIIYEYIDDPSIAISPVIITSMIDGPSRLTNLRIDYDYNPIFLNSLQWLISYCQSSLKEFTLTTSDSSEISGQHLETLLQPCQQLTKLVFALKLENDDIDIIEILRQYQTDWWLDPCRPPVFLHDNEDYIRILTMPCTLAYRIDLGIDLNTWLLNKGQLDSPLICFKKANWIEIVNSDEEPVTLDFLRLIARIFPASPQNLTFSVWSFYHPEILYEQLRSGAVITPQLPHVRNFGADHTYYYGLDATSLIIWLLVAPNVKELDITYMSTDKQFQLAKDLDRILQTDPNLKLIFNQIEKLTISSSGKRTAKSLEDECFFLFSKLFQKVIVFQFVTSVD